MNEPIAAPLQLLIGVVLLVLGAQFSIEINLSETNIPITGQTLAVILVAYFLRSYLGAFAVFLYLLIGGLGFPVFAEGASGWEKFSGGSGGFLIGFLVAAFLIGGLKNRGELQKFQTNIAVNLFGTLSIVLVGVLWLSKLYGFNKGLEYGFYPFWKGAVIKILIGILIIAVADKISGIKS